MLKTGSKLPVTTLTSVPDGASAKLLVGQGPHIILVAPGKESAGYAPYLDELAKAAPLMAEWGGHIVVVVPGPVAAAETARRRVGENVTVLADPEGKLRTIGPALIVTDEWGEIYFSASTADVNGLPGAEELGDWARFVAIQCPECEAPEGEWRNL